MRKKRDGPLSLSLSLLARCYLSRALAYIVLAPRGYYKSMESYGSAGFCLNGHPCKFYPCQYANEQASAKEVRCVYICVCVCTPARASTLFSEAGCGEREREVAWYGLFFDWTRMREGGGGELVSYLISAGACRELLERC